MEGVFKNMHCGNCGAKLPAGAQSCPYCGAAAPYNNNPGGLAPTQQAPYPSNPGAPQVDPTVLAQPSTYPNAGGQSGDYYNQGASNPNNIPPTPYYNPSPSQPGISGANYNQPPMTPNMSGADYNPYGNSTPPPPPTPTPYAPGPVPAYPMPPQPPRKKSNVGLIIGIIAAVVVLACVGSIGFAAWKANQVVDDVKATVTATTNTPTTDDDEATVTPTTTNNSSQSPSGLPINPEAAKIITDPVTTSSIDKESYKPTNPTTTFEAGDYVYVTYNLHTSSTGLDFKNGDRGYVETRFYYNGEYGKNYILTLDDDYANAYTGLQYLKAGEGAIELYWCLQSSCSDRQLAQVVTFTVE